MFNLFKKKKSTINSIIIPNFGWVKDIEDETRIEWRNPENTIGLTQNFFDKEPDLPTITDLVFLRNFYRNAVTYAGAGLIEVDIIDVKGVKAVKTIFKVPQQPKGMVYLASITIPFEKCSYVIKIQAPELGITGMRDSVIMQKLLAENKISIGENGFENWFQDPYDVHFKSNCLMNKSEDNAYDSMFANHPLSQARKLLATIIEDIQFNPEISKNNTFNK
jgi:hypothetical protein